MVKRRIVAQLLVAALLAGFYVESRAEKLKITPRLFLGATYTDNVELAPAGEEEGEFVHEVRPSLTVSGGLGREGSRVRADLNYAYQYRESGRNIGDGRGAHRLRARGSAEIIEDFFFLDGSATVSQRNTAPGGRNVADTLFGGGDTETVFGYQISPTFRQRFGRYASAVVRLESSDFQGQSIDGETRSSDSTSEGFNASIASGSEFPVTPWQLSYSQRTVDFEDEGGDSRFRNVSGTVSYRGVARVTPFVTVGYSDNDFPTRNEDRLSSMTWRAGLSWSPSQRTQASVSYGEQPFGESWAASANHRRRRSVFSVNYAESFTTQRDLLLERVVVEVVDPFGNPIEDPLTGDLLLIPIDIIRTTNETFVNRRLGATYALQGKRYTFRIGLNHSRRSFELSGEEDTTRGLQASLSRPLSRKASAALSSRWQEFETDDTKTGEIWDARLSYRYRFSQKVSLNASLVHVENDARDAVNNYEENRITSGLTVTF